MKIALLTYGSRGDVQPFLALAVGLKNAGHSVRMAAPAVFSGFIEQHGIECSPLPGSPETISARMNDAGRNPIGVMKAISSYVEMIAPQVLEKAFTTCLGMDCIVHGFLFTAGAHSIACQLKIPDISIQFFPMFAPTRNLPNVSVAWLPAGALSYASHLLFDQIFRRVGESSFRRLQRAQPNLPLEGPLRWPFSAAGSRTETPLVFAFSRLVIPAAPEWTRMKNLHISGYFFLEEKNYRLPDALEAFLAAGEPPVCITFGSMVNAGLKRLGSEILKALEQAEKRAVILTGWGSWDPPRAGSRDILYLDSAPHERLFPRCSLVIHHGSAGTTAAALKAGVPSMAVPLAGDQPFWAKRLDELGVGPQSIPGRRLSARGLSAAMQEAGSSTCRKKAQALGMKLSEEDGISAAISLIEEHMGAFRA